MSYRILNRFCLSLILTVTSGVPAFADNEPTSINDIRPQNDCYKKKLEACKTRSNTAMEAVNAGGQAGVAQAQNQQLHSGATTFGNAQAMGGVSLQKIADDCQKEMDQCDQTCEAEEKKSKKPAKKNCKEDYGKLIKMLKSGATGLTLNSLGTASTTGSMQAEGGAGGGATTTTPGDNKPATRAAEGGGGSGMGSMMNTMLPLAMMGAMLGMQASKNDDDDEAKQQQQLQQQYALASNSALQANGTLDCSKSDGGYYSACNTYLAAACQQAMTNATFSASPTCTNFAGRYCGTGTGSPYTTPYTIPYTGVAATTGTTQGLTTGTTTGTATTGMPTLGLSGEGRATTFCTTALAYNYCQVGGRTNCPSCQGLSTSTSAGCAQQPALCVGQTSAALVAQARTTCPDDPIFANPAYSSTAVATAPAVVSPIASAVVLGTTSPGLLPTATPSPTLQTASIGGRDVATAAGATGPTSDITGQYGPSVFSTSTQAIGKLCQTGQLNCP